MDRGEVMHVGVLEHSERGWVPTLGGVWLVQILGLPQGTLEEKLTNMGPL